MIHGAPVDLDHALAVLGPVLALAPPDYLGDLRQRLKAEGIVAAVTTRRSDVLFDWLTPQLALQGISDHSAFTYARSRPAVTFADIAVDLTATPPCPRLRAYWVFADCGYRKSAATCAEPDLLKACSLPCHDLRKGALNVAVHGLFLMIRDVFDGDIVGWIDNRLAQADPGVGVAGRTRAMRASILDPLCEIAGTGPKLWGMVISTMLLGGDPDRERWVSTGASFVAVDSLVHAWLHRTGIARRAGREHPYGPACYAPGGCAEMIEEMAIEIDVSRYGLDLPQPFPRWVQWAIWHFCAASGWAICNGRQIDDRERCDQRLCPCFRTCDRIAIG